MPDSTGYAQVALHPKTRDQLRSAKTGGESYDDVVRRLLSDADHDETPMDVEVTTE